MKSFLIKPTVCVVWLSIALLALSVVVWVSPDFRPLWNWVAGLIIAILVVDLVLLFGLNQFSVNRTVNRNLPIYSWSEVKVQISHAYSTNVKINLHDFYPDSFIVEGQPSDVIIPEKTGAEIGYAVKPLQRGDAIFTGTDVGVTSPLKLWKRKLHVAHENHVRVYPNFAEIAHFALLATDNHLSQMGVRRRQRRGEGLDFHQLREYRLGDSVKQIDWKATSRYQKLISREYQDERDQQIIFLVDCGRRMRHLENGQAHLDQALNAMLLLSYVAIRQGDAAGFLSFAGSERWCPPEKGVHVVNQLLTKAYDLPSTTQAADYLSVARKLVGLQRKRSLIVILTNTRDEDSHDLQQAARLMSRRHLVVLADLREPGLQDVNKNAVTDLDSALLFQGVQDYLYRRQKGHDALQHAGAICIDTTAEQLPIRLVNQYLEIKHSGRL